MFLTTCLLFFSHKKVRIVFTIWSITAIHDKKTTSVSFPGNRERRAVFIMDQVRVRSATIGHSGTAQLKRPMVQALLVLAETPFVPALTLACALAHGLKIIRSRPVKVWKSR